MITEPRQQIAFVGLREFEPLYGGIEKYIYELTSELDKLKASYKIYNSRNETSGLGMIFSTFFATLKAIRDRNTVINFHSYSSFLNIFLCKMTGIKACVTVHGFESGWENPKYNNTEKWLIKKIFSYGIRNADIVFTVAQHALQKIKIAYGKEAFYLPSGIRIFPTVDIPPLIKDIKLTKNRYVLFLGRMDRIKRVDWLIDANSILNKHDTYLVIAGGLNKEDRYVQQLIKDVSENIVFTDFVSGDVKTWLLQNCLFFINPSSNEGIPISVLEAMAAGKAVLCSDIDAHLEVVKDKENGFLFSANDFNDFTNKLDCLLKMPHSEIDQIGQNNRRLIQERACWQKVAIEFIRLCGI